MVETFTDWCFDSSRQPGDNGMVETEYGYHLMYFISTTGELVAADAAASSAASEQADAEFDIWLDKQLEGMDYTVNQENVYQW